MEIEDSWIRALLFRIEEAWVHMKPGDIDRASADADATRDRMEMENFELFCNSGSFCSSSAH